MLRSLEELRGYDIAATDGELGSVDDFYFDDERWTIRYVVVDTGPWLFGRKVLIAADAITSPDWPGRRLGVNLTKEQVENSPDIDLEQPVSRQQEITLRQYYGWPAYWGAGAVPKGPLGYVPPMPRTATFGEREAGNPDLRSLKEVTGYHIQATDGEIGHADDFLADDEIWSIHYMLVDTRNWLPGRKVLVPLDWITGIDWLTAEVRVDVTKDQIKNSPEYDPSEALTREYEERMYRHYGQEGYWVY